MQERRQLPLEITVFVDRTVEDYLSRPYIFYLARPSPNSTDIVEVTTHLISLDTAPEDRKKIEELRNRLYKSREYPITGTRSFSSLAEYSDWSRDIMSDIWRACEDLMEE
jgi:hypothetical protein